MREVATVLATRRLKLEVQELWFGYFQNVISPEALYLRASDKGLLMRTFENLKMHSARRWQVDVLIVAPFRVVRIRVL